jgi:hypothetical protein
MIDTATWCVAVFLVCAGVAADGYLAWMFTRDWHAGRADERARRDRWVRGAGKVITSRSAAAASDSPAPSSHRYGVLACSGLAAVVMTTAVAAAQPAAPQDDGGTPPASSSTQLVEDGHAGQTSPSTPSEANSAAGSASTAAPVGSAISVQLNLDFTNAYFYRGIRQQDKGLIVQPAARLTTRLVDDAEVKLDGFLGTWNSFGPNGGTQTGALVEDWYESDLYAGFTLSHGKLSLTTSYTFLTSPSDAFQTVEELGFTLALDDSDWMKAWALKPYATLAIETGSNGSDGPDLDNGAYLELGIAPGFSFDMGKTPVTLTFPASVGLSLSDYYQNAGGSDDTFGFAQIGAKASIPLGEPGRFGTWTLNAGVSVLLLGDHTKAFNNGDDTEVIGSVGLQWNF